MRKDTAMKDEGFDPGTKTISVAEESNNAISSTTTKNLVEFKENVSRFPTPLTNISFLVR